MALHTCTDCGLLHDHEGTPTANPEVEIARIQADRDVRVAELQRGEFNKTELEAETEIKVAEIEAAAAVDEATVKADVLDDILTPPEPEPDPEPVVIVDDPEAAEPEEDTGPPEIEVAPPGAAKKSNPWW